MDLTTFIYNRSKVSLKVILNLYKLEYTDLISKKEIDSNLTIIGKNKNIIKYNYDILKIIDTLKNKKIETVSNYSKTFNFLNFIDKLHTILQNFNFEKIDANIITNEFFNYELLNINLKHPDRSKINTFLSDDFSLCKNTARIYNILKNNNLKVENTSLINKNGEIYSPLSLRTHTTASIYEYLYENKFLEKKDLYLIGDIFRRQSEDALHLIQFTQLELFSQKCKNYESFIILIQNIMSELGFKKCKIIPTKYPYTEPSFQVEVFYNNKWIEIGGGGLFIKFISKNVTPFVSYGFGFGCERLYLLLNEYTELNNINEI